VVTASILFCAPITVRADENPSTAAQRAGLQQFENNVAEANRFPVKNATDESSIDPDRATAEAQQINQLQQQIEQLQAGMQQMQKGMGQLEENLKVTTVDKSFGIGIFGSLNGEMLFSQSRPFLPSAPVLLFPDLGRDTQTFEAHAKSTNLGAGVQGPEIFGLQSGGAIVTFLYGEQFEDDRYGIFVARAFGELKNDDVRYAFGLEGDVINPLSPTMVNWNVGASGGNLGFLRGQFRMERYFHFSETSQLTAQFALADPVSTSFGTGTGFARGCGT
jgi:hypothetical protein